MKRIARHVRTFSDYLVDAGSWVLVYGATVVGVILSNYYFTFTSTRHKRSISILEALIGLFVAWMIVRRSEGKRHAARSEDARIAMRKHLPDRILVGYAHGMTWRLSTWIIAEIANSLGLSSLVSDAVTEVIGG